MQREETEGIRHQETIFCHDEWLQEASDRESSKHLAAGEGEMSNMQAHSKEAIKQ